MRVAESYKNYNYDETKAYDKSGKLYVTATCKCGRCVNGIYVCRIENGQPVPHPNAGGICFNCGGTGIERKEIRLYTDKEFAAMERAKERAAARREEERLEKEKQLIAAAPKKIADTLSKNGFNDKGVTYVALGNTYAIKDELKDAGFKFDKVLKWHGPAPRDYNCIAISQDEIFQFNELGDCFYKTGAADVVQKKIDDLSANKNSEWIGAEKEKISDYPVKLIDIRGFETIYGYSQCVKFEDESGNEITWFTKTEIKFPVGSDVLMSATIKKLDEYKGTKQTVVTRAKLKEA